MTNKNLSIKETLILATQSYHKKDFKNATNLCKKILSINSNHCETIFLLGLLEIRDKNLDSAKRLFSQIIDIEPLNVRAHNNLGNVLKELGNNKEAIISFNKVIKIDPRNTNAHYNLGGLFYKLREFKKAESFFKSTVEIQPNYAMAYFNLANVSVELKDLEKAVSYYQKTIAINPKLPSAYNNLGLVYRNLNDFENAIINYKKSIEINSKHASSHHNLGIAYKEIGNFDKAIESHEMAIKCEPENLVNYYYLGELKKDILTSDLKEKIKKIIDKKDNTKVNLSYGNYLLSQYEQKEKNYDKEINYLIEGHQNFFLSKKEKFTLAIKYCFEDILQIEKFASVKKSKNKIEKDIKPVFIIGVPRCGSTLVEKIITSGKQKIPMGEETSVLENFVNKKILEKQSLELGEDHTLRDEIYNIYQNKGLILEKYNYMFTDKSLNNFFYIDLIKNIFPSSKIIHCKRDYVSSIMSIFQNNLTELSWTHSLVNIFRYFDNYIKITENLNSKYPGLVYNLKFEELVNNPEDQSKKLMQFCNLPWDASCLEFYKRKDLFSKTASNIQIRKPIFKNSPGKYLIYKKYLNEYGKKYSWFK